MENIQTKKGTKLPLLDLRGSKYLQVMWRIFWFREEHPYGRIDSERIESTEKYVLYKANISILNEKGEYVKIADGFKREDYAHFADANEKAQTGAIGRALALCGYGTQFAPELEEQERIVDSPVVRAHLPTKREELPHPRVGGAIHCECGAALIKSAKKGSFYCPNFKNTAQQHDRPISEEEYNRRLVSQESAPDTSGQFDANGSMPFGDVGF